MARPCISATARDFKIIMSRVPCRTLVGSGAKRISYRLSIADQYAPSYRMSIGMCGGSWPGPSACGLRRATLRAKPTGQKNRDPIGRPRRGSSFLGLASEKFFKSNSRKKQKEVQNEKRGHFY